LLYTSTHPEGPLVGMSEYKKQTESLGFWVWRVGTDRRTDIGLFHTTAALFWLIFPLAQCKEVIVGKYAEPSA